MLDGSQHRESLSHWSIVALQRCQFLLVSKVNQLYVYTYRLFPGLPLHLGRGAVSRGPCTTEQLLSSCLIYTQNQQPVGQSQSPSSPTPAYKCLCLFFANKTDSTIFPQIPHIHVSIQYLPEKAIQSHLRCNRSPRFSPHLDFPTRVFKNSNLIISFPIPGAPMAVQYTALSQFLTIHGAVVYARRMLKLDLTVRIQTDKWLDSSNSHPWASATFTAKAILPEIVQGERNKGDLSGSRHADSDTGDQSQLIQPCSSPR